MHAVGRLILAPRLLPLLLAAWLAAPSGPKGGLLFFDSLVHEEALTRGAWPAVLSARASFFHAPRPGLDHSQCVDGCSRHTGIWMHDRPPSRVALWRTSGERHYRALRP